MDKDTMMALLDAQANIEDAIENLHFAARHLAAGDYVECTIIANLEQMLSKDSGWLGGYTTTIADLLQEAS